MAAPSNPPNFEHFATRPFSFYPPIVGFDVNQWLFLQETWAEIQVVNCGNKQELWIPRHFAGEVSKVDDPVLIIGLTAELELKAGSLVPVQRRVINMPPAPGAKASDKEMQEAPPNLFGTRLEASDKRIFRLVGIFLAVAMGLYLVMSAYTHIGQINQKVLLTAKDQSFFSLGAQDDYLAVVQKLGTPTSERWQSETGAIQYHALEYSTRKFTVVLMGSDRGSALYIGTMDPGWHPIHSAAMRGGGSTLSLMRQLKRF